MFKKIKDILGIEGVKIKVICPEETSKTDAFISGRVIVSSKSKQHVESLTIKLIEKYQRGRNESTLINDYLVSQLELDINLDLDDSQPAKLDFELPLNLLKSDMDKYEDKNILAKGLVSLAKKLKGVKSYYRVEAIAHIKGAALDAIATTPIQLN